MNINKIFVKCQDDQAKKTGKDNNTEVNFNHLEIIIAITTNKVIKVATRILMDLVFQIIFSQVIKINKAQTLIIGRHNIQIKCKNSTHMISKTTDQRYPSK